MICWLRGIKGREGTQPTHSYFQENFLFATAFCNCFARIRQPSALPHRHICSLHIWVFQWAFDNMPSILSFMFSHRYLTWSSQQSSQWSFLSLPFNWIGNWGSSIWNSLARIMWQENQTLIFYFLSGSRILSPSTRRLDSHYHPCTDQHPGLLSEHGSATARSSCLTRSNHRSCFFKQCKYFLMDRMFISGLQTQE